MKNKFTLKLSLVKFSLLLSFVLLSQSKGYSQIYYERFCVGVGLTHFKYEGHKISYIDSKGLDSNYVLGNALPITAYFNWNIPIINIKNHSAIGINPGITFSANPFTLGFSTPVFLSYKFGTDAQVKQEGSKLGFAVGLGYALGGYASEDYEFLFKKPQLMAEISLQTRSLVNKLRLTLASGRFTSNIKPNEDTAGGYYEISSYASLTYLMTFEK